MELPSQEEVEPKSVYGLLAYVLRTQGLNAGLLCALLGAIGWALTVQVPKHLENIKAGYVEQAATFKEMQTQQRVDFKEMLKEQRDVHTKSIEQLGGAVDKQTVVLEKLVDEMQRDHERPFVPLPKGTGTSLEDIR